MEKQPILHKPDLRYNKYNIGHYLIGSKIFTIFLRKQGTAAKKNKLKKGLLCLDASLHLSSPQVSTLNIVLEIG